MSDNTQHRLNESADKIRLSTDVTRGEAPRDQEKHKIKVRADTPEEAAENLDATLRELEERDVFARARNIQPIVTEDDE